MPPRSRISNFEWKFVLGVYLIIDVAQIALDAFLIGVAINRYLDFVAGGGLALYLYMRKYKFDGEDWLWFFGIFAAEEVPLLDIGLFWTYDVWRTMKKDKMRPAA